MMRGAVVAAKAAEHKAQEPSRRIVFVCTGNTCRSPMAAAVFNDLARKRGEGASAVSAGLFATEGAPITPAAVQALQKAGIPPVEGLEYTAHCAHTVNAQDVADADLVVGLTASHAMQLTMRFPEAASKIGTLPMDIPDPYGGTQEEYDLCLASLRYCIELAFFGELA